MGTKLLLGFGGTVIQVVVHLPKEAFTWTTSFGGTVNQAVVHLLISCLRYAPRFRGTANQAIVHPLHRKDPSWNCFGSTVIQVVVHRPSQDRAGSRVSELP